MQIKPKKLLAMLAMVGISAAATPVNAATFAAGDLLLGFHASGGTGASSTYVVNLGQADTIYRDATGNISSIIDIGSALTAIYGADWSTRSDLSWGIAGVRSNAATGAVVDGDPVKTSYVSAAQTMISPGTQQSTEWVVPGSTTRATIANNISDVQAAFAAAAGYGGTNGNLTAEIFTSVDNSWEDKNTGMDSFGLGDTIEGNFGAGASGTALDLYRILNTNTGANPTGIVGTGSYEGTFTISSDGVVSFSVGAVPEPSRAILAGAGLAGLMLRRRRRAIA